MRRNICTSAHGTVHRLHNVNKDIMKRSVISCRLPNKNIGYRCSKIPYTFFLFFNFAKLILLLLHALLYRVYIYIACAVDAQ